MTGIQSFLKLNSRIKMDQLTAQMNPHFLYNTLEIIRNLVVFDADKAEELIVKLTEVLRYTLIPRKGGYVRGRYAFYVLLS